MIKLFALALSGILIAQANSLAASISNLRSLIERQEHDRQAQQRRDAALIEKASRIEIEFVGNRMFSDLALLAQMKLSRDPEQPNGLILQTPASYDRLIDDLERVRFFLGSRGYVEAKTGEPKVEDLGDRVKITISIEEGARYRIGEITVKGAKVFSPEQIIEMSGFRRGEIINAETIQEKIYNGIEDAYRDRGYIQASVSFVPIFKTPFAGAPEGVVDITLEIDEGRIFFVEWIDFSGDFSDYVKSNKQTLLDCLLINDGDVFSRRLLNETLKNINGLGWFEEIREKDMIIRCSDSDQRVEIMIHVKEVGNRQKQ